jgi:SHAQKYF class myb-like DNA-binding protein
MVMTSRTHTTLFASATSSSASLVRLPLSVVPHYETRCQVTGAIMPAKPLFRTNLWSSDEHERFLHGLEMFPTGPWKEVAKVVGTKSTRQTMTHAQKYRQKIERRMNAKPKEPKEQREARLRALQPTYPTAPSKPHQPSTTNYVDESLSCNVMVGQGSAQVYTSTSPCEVFTTAFDTSFLDQELDSILASLEPLPNSYYSSQEWSV